MANETKRTAFRFHSYMRRLAYARGVRGTTFATRDELSWPGYDKAYRAGQRFAQDMTP